MDVAEAVRWLVYRGTWPDDRCARLGCCAVGHVNEACIQRTYGAVLKPLVNGVGTDPCGLNVRCVRGRNGDV